MLTPRTIQKLFWAAAGLAVAFQPALGAKGDKRHPKRSLTFKKHGNTKYSVTAKSNEGGVKSKMRFDCSVRGFPNFRLAYFTKEEDTVDGFAFRVGLLKLAEYNGTIAANDSTNAYSLRGTRGQWTAPTKEEIQADGDAKLYKLSSTMTGTGDHVNMTMRFDLFLATAGLKAGNVTYSPSSIKYTLTVLNYPYKMANSSLAILSGIFVPNTSRTYGSTKVNIGNNSTFDWDPTVYADGVVAPIEANRDMYEAPITNTNSTNDHDDGYRSTENIDFIYHLVKDVVHPANVTWDPSLGFDDSDELSSPTDPSSAPRSAGVPAVNLIFPVVLAAIMLLA